MDTGKHTARAAQDKFVVREETSDHHVWWGQYNRPFSSEAFSILHARLCGYLQGRDVFVRIDTGQSLLLSMSGTGVPAALRWWWIGCGGAAGLSTPDFRDLCTALYAQRSGVVPPETR